MRRRMTRTLAVLPLAAAIALVPAAPASAQPPQVPEPATFTSTLIAQATADQVVADDGTPAPGEPGATGVFVLRINSELDVVCYDITLLGVTPPFESPADTATHLQEGFPGESGFPRMVFPDPQGPAGGPLNSTGCLQGPFTTGVIVDGVDTGTGFTLAQLEADPPAWFVDTHTAQFRVGAVRGQLAPA